MQQSTLKPSAMPTTTDKKEEDYTEMDQSVSKPLGAAAGGESIAARVSVDQFTEAAFNGVLRAISVHREGPRPEPWLQNPILIYGIIAVPEQIAKSIDIQQPGG
jgi:hypothetical protein